MASFGDAERWSISTGDSGFTRLECAGLHRVLIESANDDSFSVEIFAQPVMNSHTVEITTSWAEGGSVIKAELAASCILGARGHI